LIGFDLVEGLQRLQGNRRLYKTLLLDFVAKYSGTADEIADALQSDDVKRTHGLVHNLKGLAGNLSARRLRP